MSAYKHLTFQFVLLELATHLSTGMLLSLPLKSVHGGFSLVTIAAFVKSKKKRNVISIHVLL